MWDQHTRAFFLRLARFCHPFNYHYFLFISNVTNTPRTAPYFLQAGCCSNGTASSCGFIIVLLRLHDHREHHQDVIIKKTPLYGCNKTALILCDITCILSVFILCDHIASLNDVHTLEMCFAFAGCHAGSADPEETQQGHILSTLPLRFCTFKVASCNTLYVAHLQVSASF